MVETSPNTTSTTKIIHSTNHAVLLLRAVLYERIAGTNIPSAKHNVCTHEQTLFTHDQSKKFKNPDTAIAMPIATITQNENLLSEIRLEPELVLRVVVLFVVFFAIIITSCSYFKPLDPGLTAAVPCLHMGQSSGR